LKYRLYNIGRIISRTLAYSIVTGLLTVVNTAVEPAHISVWTGPCDPATRRP
jgi:hypothetical protein